MKYFLLSITILCIATACKRPNKVNCIRPYTAEELNFIKTLEADGAKVELERFNYPYSGDSVNACLMWLTDTYNISISGEDYKTVSNIDSMRVRTQMIAAELYSKVLSDSIIRYTNEIVIRISSKPQKKQQGFGNRYSVWFKKTDLERYCGFRVKDDASGFRREPLKTKSETLEISKEHTID